MSLILDALKKAENERKADAAVPDIATEHDVSFEEKPKKAPWLWLTAIVLVLLFAVFAWFLFSSNSEPSKYTNIPVVENSKLPEKKQSVKELKPEPEVEQQNTQVSIDNAIQQSRQKSIKAQKELIASQYSSPTDALDETANTEKGKATETEISASVTDESIDKLYSDNSDSAENKSNTIASENPIKNNTVQDESSTVSTDVNSASAKLTSNRESKTVNTEAIEAYQSVKLIKELPFSAQEKVPTMMYTEHHYRGKKGSTVVINGKQLKQGSNVASGIRIERILEDGILLRQNQYQFKMLALNSWLNL